MAQKRGPAALPGSESNPSDGIVARVSNSIVQSSLFKMTKSAASKSQDVSWKVLKKTGSAMWFASTVLLVLVVPLIVEIDKEQQINEQEAQNATVFGTPMMAPAK
ncbi:hypothetical protein AMTRI_Chr07g76490 [Amborella trichopoda]|uniref:mitochondrial import receptor subunit TOM9-2-like n=1 Tax=Amborella trichopoda TaxID=13333 RepID=UPI0005D439A8|nr:mitochondrial import receptor subunit TOM9-2-like [Amborella trichopoda]|eukprot:XP_011627057.1 mitochondrial import receptor subunit TOM9-2-like [Amborella trichopoda]